MITKPSDILMQRLREAAEEDSLAVLEDKLKIAKSTLSRLISGERRPTAEHLDRMAIYFKLRIR